MVYVGKFSISKSVVFSSSQNSYLDKEIEIIILPQKSQNVAATLHLFIC